MKQIKRMGSLILAVGLLLGAAGCGQGTDAEEHVTKDMEQGGADGQAASVENQLQVFIKSADKWMERENREEPYLTYAVTDLDQNGRLEILASADRQGSGRFSYTEYYQVNEAGDDIEKIQTDYEEGESEADLVNDLTMAYYDPEKKEYHYITGDFATAGTATGYVESVDALTLKDGRLRTDCLGYESCERDKNGKEKTTYYKMESGKEKKVSKIDFNRDLLGDTVYPDCGKMNTHIGWFQLKNKGKKITEEYLLYQLRQSAGAFSLADPLMWQEMEGFPCRVPQYRTMSDQNKQKRLNQLIVREAGKSLKGVETDTFRVDADACSCTVKQNDAEYLSLLVEGSGMGVGAAHPIAWADTVTIDRQKETVLTQTDLLPKDEREWIEEDILDGDCEEIRDVGYRAWRQKEDGEHLLEPDADWKDVSVYRTQDSVGVVIPTMHAAGDYQIYEVRRDDFQTGTDWDQVDWEAYQYTLPADDYKVLQTYMPLIKGEKSFLWNREEKEDTTLVEATIPQYFEKMEKNAEVSDLTFSLDYIRICDVTQDGEKELVLSFNTLGYFDLILHKEGDRFYGTYYHVRSFEDLRENGIFHGYGGSGCVDYYQVRFAGGLFKTTCLGGHERDGKKLAYYIGKKNVTEKEFEKWRKKLLGKVVKGYEPFDKTL